MVTVTLLVLLFSARASLGFIVPKSTREELSGQALVDHLNSVQSLFRAELSNFSQYKVMEHKYGEPAHEQELFVKHVVNIESKSQSLPKHFDAREQWPKCRSIRNIRDQGGCGSCWAFSTSELMSDRVCIQSKGVHQSVLSPQDLLTCSQDNGCSGGWPFHALSYWNSTGVVSDECRPYKLVGSGTPGCDTTCVAGYPESYNVDKRFGNYPYSIPRGDVSSIQWDILNHGPVSATFQVFQDFFAYKSGVYKHTSGGSAGYHAVKVIGWGEENGVKYWIIANSWGLGFGERGFFRMIRGVNDCGIEGSIVAATANLKD